MAVKENDVLTAALRHAERGTPVVPLKPRDKYPLLGIDEQTGLGGLHRASTDEAQIREWWTQWPDAGLGLRTGVTFDVIDIDVPRRELLSRTAQELLAPLLDGSGPLVRSGGGGWHYYVQVGGVGNTQHLAADEIPEDGVLPEGAPIPGAGFDIRGKNGLIKTAPSLHQSGNRYVEIRSFDNPLPEFPAPVIEAMRSAAPEYSRSGTSGPSHSRPSRLRLGAREYGRRALDSEMDRLRQFREGSGVRNAELNRSGYKMFRLVGGGELRDAEVVEALTNVALEIGLEPREIAATIRSARKGIDNPRMSQSREQALGSGSGSMRMSMTIEF